MGYKIIADSSCDIWELEGADFCTVPLTISTEERTYVDDENMNVTDMLDYLAKYKSRSYTACPSTHQWLEAFGDVQEIYIATMTSALSGTYNSAVAAKEHYLEQYPDAKICIVDSLSTSGELLLIIEKLQELKAAGCSFEEVSKQIMEYKKTTRLFFAFQSLHNLAQNGRLPKVVATALGVLGITVIGTASEEGTVAPTTKARGIKKVVATVLGEMEKAGYKGGKVDIAHVENEELARAFEAAVKEKYPQAITKYYPVRGLVAYYGERGGMVLGCECE